MAYAVTVAAMVGVCVVEWLLLRHAPRVRGGDDVLHLHGFEHGDLAAGGDLIALAEGLKAGEEVVTIGQSKLRPGTLLQVNNTVVPASSPTPKPDES